MPLSAQERTNALITWLESHFCMVKNTSFCQVWARSPGMEDLPGLKSAIATVLRRVRREARLSQQKLADFAGLSRIHIAQLEGRRQNATLNVLLLIAMALNLDGLSLLRMLHEEMLRTGHGRRKSVRRKAERQDEPHQEALPKETGKQSPSPPE